MGLLASPLVGPALIPLVLGVAVFTALLPATLRSPTLNGVAEVLVLAAGLLITLPLTAVGSAASSAVAFATFVGFLELLLDAVPGFALRMRNDLLAPGWVAAVGRRWGPSPLQDQRLAGAILWALAEILDLPFLALLVVQWIRADEREAAATDAALDAATRRVSVTTGGVEQAMQRPWWETDATVLGSARARALQGRRDENDTPSG